MVKKGLSKNIAYIGYWEELILLMAALLQSQNSEAYGASIGREIATRYGHNSNIGSISLTISRLEKKKLIKTIFGKACSKRGGRRKKLVYILPAGIRALEEGQSRHQQMLELWENIHGKN